MATCKRCGACCWVFKNGRITDCPYLVRDKDKTSCKIYYRRLGRKIGKDMNGNPLYCNMRMNTEYDYPNCPYNTNKPLIPIKLERQK